MDGGLKAAFHVAGIVGIPYYGMPFYDYYIREFG
jgi:hypothetical protein